MLLQIEDFNASTSRIINCHCASGRFSAPNGHITYGLRKTALAVEIMGVKTNKGAVSGKCGKKRQIRQMCRKAAVLALVITAALPAGNAYAAQEQMLVPVGRTVGISADIDGAVVINTGKTKEIQESPAQDCGIRAGDIIVGIGDMQICCAQDVKTAVNKCGGQPVTVRLIRGCAQQELVVTPTLSESGGYEIGVWLRDSIYGLGTVTFMSPETGLFCALGHAITDADTGVLVPLEGGQILPAQITGIVRGQCGTPGQLQGSFGDGAPLGSFSNNTVFGISGHMGEASDAEPVAVETDLGNVTVGAAVIMTDAAGNGPEEYAVEISRVYAGGGSGRELMITVTDERLLELTGGIVQGMSGSPILQNGKLVGAVTHVLVNNPAKGYGVFVQSMLSAAGVSETAAAAEGIAA